MQTWVSEEAKGYGERGGQPSRKRGTGDAVAAQPGRSRAWAASELRPRDDGHWAFARFYIQSKEQGAYERHHPGT